MDKNLTIEKRMEELKKIYSKLEEILDKLPDSLPESVKETITKSILGNEELKDLMEGIEKRRPPRLLLVGRTGVGKSSLINALCEGYVAEVNDVKSCTANVKFYSCKDGERVLFDIMDSRGIAENVELDDGISAEEDLLNGITEFNPDAVLFVLRCDIRDESINEDIEFLKKARQRYYEYNYQEIPVIVVVNRADAVPSPRDTKVPYQEKKLNKINQIVEAYKNSFREKKFKVVDVIAVSSLIEWQNNGEYISTDEIEYLTEKERQNLKVEFDGRYNIETLRDTIEEAIQDYEAKMGFKMALKLDELVLKLAKQIRKIFGSIAGIVAATPIPLSDIYILVTLQAVMVMMIAILSGRKMSIQLARDFILSIGGIGVSGFSFRLLAQQASKLLNLIVPVAGSAISTAIATGGTLTIGSAAIEYYIKDKDLEEVKHNLKKYKESERE